MDIKQIIESGKLELYALGALDEQDQKEIETLLSEHPTLREEYDQIAEALHVYGRTYSPEPPSEVLNKVKEQIAQDEVLPLRSTDKRGNSAPWWSVAATILLLLSIGLNIKLNSDLKDSQAAYLSLEQETQQMVSNTVEWKTKAEQGKELLSKISTPAVKKVYMAGTENYPELGSTVFWDQNKKELYLAKQDLAVLDENQQYQLWAIIDGKPVDAGVFDAGDGLIAMPGVAGEAVAFAVTIEPRGGSEQPTLEKMCMLGEV